MTMHEDLIGREIIHCSTWFKTREKFVIGYVEQKSGWVYLRPSPQDRRFIRLPAALLRSLREKGYVNEKGVIEDSILKEEKYTLI